MIGIDVSEHQDGLSLVQARSEGVEFVIIRLCDGTYVDRVFQSHLDDAEMCGLPVSTYWYLRAPSEGTTIAEQVDVIDSQMNGRRDLGVWIDVESTGRFRKKLLTLNDITFARTELLRRGYRVCGIYTGAWYWRKIRGGEPSMTGLGYLWASNYGHNHVGVPAQLYEAHGGDDHPGWDYPLGNRIPDILQFGSRGTVAGREVDINAFRGTPNELKKIFYGGRV